MNRIITILLISVVAISCSVDKSNVSFSGFWEGPHPDNPNKKFYIRITNPDSCRAQGYWTENGFYSSGFVIDSLIIDNNSLRFYVPEWNCTYVGQRSDECIYGGFACSGEPFDSVLLVKNKSVAKFLTDAIIGCNSPEYSYSYKKPQQLNDLLNTATLKASGDSIFVYSLLPEIIHGEYGRLNSFLMIRNKKLICEEYFYGYDRNTLHQVESATKSITSLLVGIAIDNGYIADTDKSVAEILDAPDFDKRITLEHVLTMTSGLTPNDQTLQTSENRIKTVLSCELNNQPGTKFQYDGGNTELLGAIIKKTTGIFADIFARDYLFDPLQIKQYNWEYGKQDGYPCMAGALELTPREMTKIGLLILNKGEFYGKQVISKKWIDQSTSFKTHTHIPADDYAYQWWNLSLESAGEEYPCIWANGFGSQFIYIFPTLDMVIVTTGHNYEFDSWAISSGIAKYLYLLN